MLIRSIVAALVMALGGCSLPRNVVVLIPDEGGTVGGIVVSKAGAQHEISRPYAAISTDVSARSREIFSAGQSAVDSAFAGALAAKPRPPSVFVILFILGQAEVDPASNDTLAEAMTMARRTSNADISVAGHSDAIGDDAVNRALSLRRARVVYDALVFAGVRSSVIEIEYHGSSNPSVPTPRNVPEPRNRRVEVTIR